MFKHLINFDYSVKTVAKCPNCVGLFVKARLESNLALYVHVKPMKEYVMSNQLWFVKIV